MSERLTEANVLEIETFIAWAGDKGTPGLVPKLCMSWREQRQHIAALQARLKGRVCEVCWFSAEEPTPEGPRCGYCWLKERLEGCIADRERVRDACIEAVSKSDLSGSNKAHVYSALRALSLTGQ